MQTTDETSRELRRVINAVHDLSELESQISDCKTIDEVENIRLRCQAIQFYDREHPHDIGPNLVAWAKRVAVRCQLRITELQELAKKKKQGDVTFESNVAASSQKVRRSEQRVVNSMPKEELQKQLDAGVTNVQKLARIARKMRKKPELKSTPKQLERRMARYYRDKEKKRSPTLPPPKLSPAQKFTRYWTQEKKLLQQFFADSDLSSIDTYWLREFQSYRKEVEDGKRERDNALAKLKTTTTSGKDSGLSEVKINA